MKNKISRRNFLLFSASLCLIFPFQKKSSASDNRPSILYPETISVLKLAFNSEMTAHTNYLSYSEKATAEKYPNIAYMFKAFAFSEKIHAENYNKILNGLNTKTIFSPILINVDDTQSNLSKAAQKELEKIEITYPRFLKEIESEGYDEAIKNLIYSWKSHRQHEEKIKKIHKYASYFFGSVATEIESMTLEIHVCEVCGSTIEKAPTSTCDICNKAPSNYIKIDRPT